MREILFRGKAKANDEGINFDGWVYGSLLIRRCGEYEICGRNNRISFVMPVIPETVGQFTGLYDRNGFKVFEGDVLEIERKSDGLGTYYDPPLKYPAKVVVRWDMCSWLWEVCGKEKYYLHFPDAWCHYKCQVVGNIHDNPELVKEETK